MGSGWVSGPVSCDQKNCSVSRFARLISSGLLAKFCLARSMWGRGAKLLPATELEPKPCFWKEVMMCDRRAIVATCSE